MTKQRYKHENLAQYMIKIISKVTVQQQALQVNLTQRIIKHFKDTIEKKNH